MKLAYYTSGKNPSITITEGYMQGGQVITSQPVKGKREASAIAKAHGAKPWNF